MVLLWCLDVGAWCFVRGVLLAGKLHHRFRMAMNVKFFVDMPEMGPDGVVTDIDAVSDFLRGDE